MEHFGGSGREKGERMKKRKRKVECSGGSGREKGERRKKKKKGMCVWRRKKEGKKRKKAGNTDGKKKR